MVIGVPLTKLVCDYWAPEVAVWRLRAGGVVAGMPVGTQVVGTGPTGAEEVRRLPERV
ncbi:hypothetical protein [Streptomyces sp. NPDC096339]|uniref:hypothetical protein n=1 Tax=Streptomyces sp. NPDC096339 TaxID=3366086 RepID=UPI0037F602D2